MALAAILIGSVPLATSAVAAPGPAQSPEWWFDSWDVPGLWNEGARGGGVIVAVIDTGVQASIPELTDAVITGTDFTGRNGDGETDYDTDAFGHGTAMASLIAAKSGYANIQGIAPDAKIMPISVALQGSGVTAQADPDGLPHAIIWAADHGAKIISMSLGGRRDPTRDKIPCPADDQNAITYAISKGAIVVAASGNEGDNGSPVEEPGVCLGVVSVGAVDKSLSVPSWSSRHPYLTLAAPGVAIPTLSRTRNSAYVGAGTSHATAITSGALALVWSKFPNLTGRQVVGRVLATVQDVGPTGQDDAYGYGFVRPDLAIRSTLPASIANPVFEALDPYLSRLNATAAPTLSAAPAAATASAPPGEYARASEPPSVPKAAQVGFGVAAAALVGALMLLVFGVQSMRRKSAHAAAINSHRHVGDPPVNPSP
jgi:subtilisin family serine protease